MNVIYIGDYYLKSETMLSSIYQIDGVGSFKRTDWGEINIALKEGKEVFISPANREEIDEMNKRLKENKVDIHIEYLDENK